MDIKDLSKMNVFLDVVRADPTKAAELSRVMAAQASPTLERAVRTIVDVVQEALPVDQVPSPAEAREHVRKHLQSTLQSATEATEDVARQAVSAMTRFFG